MALYAIGDIQGCAARIRRAAQETVVSAVPRSALARGRPRQPRPRFARRAARASSSSAAASPPCSAITTCICSPPSPAAASCRLPIRSTTVLAAPDADRHRSTGYGTGRCCTTTCARAARSCTPASRRVGPSRKRARTPARSRAAARPPLAHLAAASCTATSPLQWSDKLDREEPAPFHDQRAHPNALLRSARPARLQLLGPARHQRKGLGPGSTRRRRARANAQIVFGHWAALGLLRRPDVTALDSGCVWGGCLTAVRLDQRAGPVKVDCAGVRCSAGRARDRRVS